MKIINITLASVLLASVAYGAVPFTFNKGEVISAQKMNENFSTLESRMSAIP